MKEKTTIIATRKELLDLSDEELIKLFENRIRPVHGGGFTFKNQGDVFIAEKEVSDVPDIVRSKEIRNLIGDVEFSQIGIVTFIKKAYDPSREKTGLGIRMYNGIHAIGDKVSLQAFLETNPKNLRMRNFGDRTYLKMCEVFRELGFDAEKYPVFKNEQQIRKKIL